MTKPFYEEGEDDDGEGGEEAGDTLNVEVVERAVVYQGFFAIEKIQLKHRLFRGGWSKLIARELFVRGNAVAAIVYDPVHSLIGLVEQFRIGLLDSKRSMWCREVVAGMAEVSELNEEVILRELQEEAGITSRALHEICEYYSSPGGTSEKLQLYCAVADLREAGGLFGLPEESEDIRFSIYPAKDVLENIYSGDYANAATLICLQWLAANKQRLSVSDIGV